MGNPHLSETAESGLYDPSYNHLAALLGPESVPYVAENGLCRDPSAVADSPAPRFNR